MKTGKNKRVSLSGIILAVVMAGVLLLFGKAQAAAGVTCPNAQSTRLVLNGMEFPSSTGNTKCYRFLVPAFTARVEVAFNASIEGNYDLYWVKGSDATLIASNLGPSVNSYVLKVNSYRPARKDRTYKLAIVPKFESSTRKHFTVGVFIKDDNGTIVNSAGSDTGTANLGSNPAGGEFIKVGAHSSVSSRFSAKCGVINIEANWRFDENGGNVKNLRLALYDPSNRLVRAVPVGKAVKSSVFRIYYPISPEQVKGSTTWTVKYVNNGAAKASVYPVIFYAKGKCPKTTAHFQKGRYPTNNYTKVREAVLSQAEPNTNDTTKGCLVDGQDPQDTEKDKSTLLYWNVDTIPNGQVVTDAYITLNIFNETHDTYYLYGMKRNWVGHQATWNRARAELAWHRPGAMGSKDRDFTILGELQSPAKGPAVIKLNQAGRRLLQSWINGNKTNFGFILANDNANDGVDFYCSASSTAKNRPMLTVVYE